MMLYTIANEYIKDLMTPEQLKEGVSKLCQFMMNEAKGLNYYLEEFTYERTIDLLKLLPDDNIKDYELDVLLFLFQEKSKKRKFKDGRAPSFSDVTLFMRKVKALKDSGKQIEPLAWNAIGEVARYIL
jgi:hypothetical protein